MHLLERRWSDAWMPGAHSYEDGLSLPLALILFLLGVPHHSASQLHRAGGSGDERIRGWAARSPGPRYF